MEELIALGNGLRPGALAAPSAMNGLEVTLKRLGIAALHTHQQVAIASIMSDRDALVCAPTGSGKSLCFIVPTLLRQKPTLVISPLVALIRAQQSQASAIGIEATIFDSLQTNEDRDRAWQRVLGGESQIIWISPERLARPSFRERIGRIDFGLVAIDEAHCVSQWGYHFRPEYRKIGHYINDISNCPRIALTATATAATRTEILGSTGLRSPTIINASPVRENLTLIVAKSKAVDEQVASAINLATSEPRTNVIYAPTRKKVDEIWNALSHRNRRVLRYHGGLPDEIRRETAEIFLKSSAPIMVATSSFGMGIDRRDIGQIVHAGFCQSLEQYAQEIGRAGRDGTPARCILLYGPRDYFLQRFLLTRTFPDAHFLFECFALAKAILESRRWVNRHWLEQELRVRINWGHQKSFKPDHGVAVEVLAREGLLLDLQNGGYDRNENLITLGEVARDQFWESYEAKRSLALDKLRKVLTYAKLPEGHEEFLQNYFES